MLLEIESIQSRLDEQFLPLEPMVTGLRLVPKHNQESGLSECERKLGVVFTSSFVALTTHFDFGHLTVGPIAFCNRGDYFAWLIDTNQNGSQNDLAWWSGAHRPEGLVMIANSDPFAILLDTKSERVLAFSHGSDSVSESFVIADRFDHFVRGVGSAMLERNPDGGNENLARRIASSVGVEPNNRFWLSVAS
ncbi:MAG: hypothetical protein ACK5Z0_00995 [Planctomycetota bacterium]